MPTRKPVSDEEASPEVMAVFSDIRTTRNTNQINNFWRYLANDPYELERTWKELKAVMGPGELDPLTKELIYLAVSISNNCTYCIHSHTAAARAKGVTEVQLGEFHAIIGMAGKTNHLATALQVPVDDAFK